MADKGTSAVTKRDISREDSHNSWNFPSLVVQLRGTSNKVSGPSPVLPLNQPIKDNTLLPTLLLLNSAMQKGYCHSDSPVEHRLEPALVLRHCALTPFANLHFLICALSVSVNSLRLARSVTLNRYF